MPWYLPVGCPVLWEELRRRLRGERGYLVLLLYGAVLTVLLIGNAAAAQLGSDPSKWAGFGRALWASALLPGQLAAVLLLSPAIAASAISMEREQRTLEMLFLTRISSLSLVSGKFLGAIGQLLVVVVSGLPIVAMVFLFGGVAPADLAQGYALVLATGLLYGSLGFLSSCLFARTTTAAVWAYGFMLLALLALPLGMLALLLLNIPVGGLDGESPWLLIGNPVLIYFLYLSRWADETTTPAMPFWVPVLVMVLASLAALLLCARLVLRLRGGRRLLGRRLSLEIARFNSRPPAAHQA